MYIPQACRDVLEQARAPATTKTYNAKWKRFCAWCSDAGLHPLKIELHQILYYFLQLANSGLKYTSIRVHLAAISRFRKTAQSSSSLYSQRIVKHFMRGLFRLCPPVRHLHVPWELNSVLGQLMLHPCEPVHIFCLGRQLFSSHYHQQVE